MGECVWEHAAMLHQLGTAMDRVVQTMDRWERQGVLPAPPPAQLGSSLSAPFPAGSSGIRLSLPQEYDGEVAKCQWFLLQLELYLATVHLTPSGHERVSALVGQRRPTLEWANTVWREGDAVLDQFEEFTVSGLSSTTRPRVDRRVSASSI
jgi:hypothetical protein